MIQDKESVALDGQVWAEHRGRENGELSTSTLYFFPEAFDLIAMTVLGEGWDCDEIYNIERIVPDLPSLHEAFTPDGELNEIGKQHLNDAKLLYLEEIEWCIEVLLEAEDEISFVPPEHYEKLINNDIMTPAAWKWALSYREKLIKKKRVEAPSRLAMIANEVCFQAERGAIETLARPLGGGRAEAIPTDLWAIDNPVHRCASAGINLSDPFNPAAPITHRLFIPRASLDAWRSARKADPEKAPKPNAKGHERSSAGAKPNAHGAAIASFTLSLLGGKAAELDGEKNETLGLMLMAEYERQGAKAPNVVNAGRDARAALNRVLDADRARQTH